MQMKVMLLNGSSHPDGCTALALRQAAKAIEEEGIETEIIFLGNAPMADCIACGHCRTDSLLCACRRRNVVVATDEAAELHRHDEKARTEAGG